jgi:CheY-like chemotaxis protein
MSRGHVLIVDDSEEICEILSVFLGRQDYTTAIAHNFGDAITEAVNNPPDLVLLDYHIEAHDTFGLMENLRERLPQLRVIFITGTADPRFFERAETHKVDAILQKPFQYADLVAKVGQVLSTVSR